MFLLFLCQPKSVFYQRQSQLCCSLCNGRFGVRGPGYSARELDCTWVYSGQLLYRTIIMRDILALVCMYFQKEKFKPNQLLFDFEQFALHRICSVGFRNIPGLDIVFMAEVLSMSRFDLLRDLLYLVKIPLISVPRLLVFYYQYYKRIRSIWPDM